MSFGRLAFSVFMTVVFGGSLVVYAQEKRVEMEFDKKSICCIVNQSIITEALEEVDGVNTAHFNMKKRKIYVYYEQSKIKIPAIVEKISKITGVEKKYIVAKTP